VRAADQQPPPGGIPEDEENDPDRLADVAVVAILRVPLTTAVVPNAVSVTLKDAVPEPPATASSSASVSSITISIISLPSLSMPQYKLIIGRSADDPR
jgi:hypothetical protein